MHTQGSYSLFLSVCTFAAPYFNSHGLSELNFKLLSAISRFSHRIYIAYSTVYSLGTLLSMQISFVGFQPVQTSEHMLALGVFGLCQIHAFVDYLRANMTRDNFNILFKSLVIGIASIISIGLAVLTLSGKVAPWTGRFYSLLDPSYAKNNIPIIASVSEHQPTSWSSFYFDLQILTFLFPAGKEFIFHNELPKYSFFSNVSCVDQGCNVRNLQVIKYGQK